MEEVIFAADLLMDIVSKGKDQVDCSNNLRDSGSCRCCLGREDGPTTELAAELVKKSRFYSLVKLTPVPTLRSDSEKCAPVSFFRSSSRKSKNAKRSHW